MSAKCYQMSFDGHVLKRGFWIYIWKIKSSQGTFYYVGRTGDSSSPHAGSPFTRIGQHLDFRENAKGNSLSRRLQAAKVKPEDCCFAMLAIGPLFPEQSGMGNHRPLRDKVAAIENALGGVLRERGLAVLGSQSSRKPLDETLFQQVVKIVDREKFILN